MKSSTLNRTKKPVKARRPSRAELNEQAWQRKRQKKRRGNPPGSRTQPELLQRRARQDAPVAKDPRIGSKKQIPLISQTDNPPDASHHTEAPRQAPDQELAQLENHPRLDTLLNQLEAGETLNPDDQHWLDRTLQRIGQLMEQLGISEDTDDTDHDEEFSEDLIRLLKTTR